MEKNSGSSNLTLWAEAWPQLQLLHFLHPSLTRQTPRGLYGAKNGAHANTKSDVAYAEFAHRWKLQVNVTLIIR